MDASSALRRAGVERVTSFGMELTEDRLNGANCSSRQVNRTRSARPCVFPMQLAVVLETDDGPIEAVTVDVSANGLLFFCR